ncbi:hypothetical protein QQ045_007322 [Rhodiola kirilowii]
MFLLENIPAEQQEVLLNLTKFDRGSFPCTYLGVPLFVGRVKVDYFYGLVERIRSRIGGLDEESAHHGRIRSLVSSFIWDKGKDRISHWVRWELICRERNAGGLWIKGLEDIMLSLHGKMAWGFIVSDSLWAKYARHRFRTGERGSCVWNSISHLICSLRDNSEKRIHREANRLPATLRDRSEAKDEDRKSGRKLRVY